MFKKLLFCCICLTLAFACSAQWQFGSGFTSYNTTEIPHTNLSNTQMWQSFGLELMSEYRLKQRKQGPLLLQDGVRLDVQMLGRYARDNGQNMSIGTVRLPLMYTNHVPLYLAGSERPVFEFNTGIGYYLAGNLRNEAFYPAGVRTYTFNHGPIVDVGITFYNQTGSRMYIKFSQTVDWMQINTRSSGLPRGYMDRGLTIGFSSAWPDTKLRWALQKQADQDRRAARKAKRG